jgi:site-specific DNA-methyltransferase (adenine-specific)
MVWAVNNTVKKAKNWTFNYKELKLLTENGKQMRNMWDIPMTSKKEKEHGKHPSQKPLKVMDRLILGLTNESELVLDPFCGSGSTAVSAKNNKRHYYVIDTNSEYIKLTKKRLATKKKE